MCSVVCPGLALSRMVDVQLNNASSGSRPVEGSCGVMPYVRLEVRYAIQPVYLQHRAAPEHETTCVA